MRIRVNDTILDQFENTVIAETFESNNLGDITNRTGGFTNNFELPLTAKNRNVLGFPDDLNIDNDNPYRKIAAELIDVGAILSY